MNLRRFLRDGLGWLGVWLLLGAAPAICAAQGSAPRNLITLDTDSTSVNGVLQILAQRSGLNIVTSPDVQGRRISVHLKDTPFEEALNLVVRSVGLGYERVGNSILVADVQKLATQTGLVTRVFELEYADAVDLRDALQKICPDATANAARNRLLIRATQGTAEQVTAIVAQLDRKPTQVLLEARLIEVNTSALHEIGIDWEKIAKWNTVVTEGDPGPNRPQQLPTEIDYLRLDQTKDYYRQANVFEVALDALITDGKARLLSDAKVVAVENKPSEVFAGQTVPVIITSLQAPGAGGGVLQTIQLEKIDVGVKLVITTRVSSDGFITTTVEPEVSRIEAFVGPDDDLPQTSTRRAKSTVRVRDGEKIFLGGLLSEESRRTEQRVPLLGSIPLLGHLFRHYRNETTNTDLVIEITPRRVGDEGAALPVVPAPEEPER